MSDRRVSFAFLSPVPFVPRRDFKPLPLSSEEIDRLWDIIGPTVHFNYRAGDFHSLQRSFVACFYQGLEHGVRMMEQRAAT